MFFILVFSIKTVLGQSTNAYKIDLLKNFNIDHSENKYEIINKDDGENLLVFAINTTESIKSLLTYKELIIFNTSCNNLRLGHNANDYNLIHIEPGHFRVIVFKQKIKDCSLGLLW